MSQRQKSFYIELIRYPTWFAGSWKTSNSNRNCYFDCFSTFSQSL